MDDIPLDGKRVLLRADLNVTVGDDGIIDENEDYRIAATIPTIQELQQRRCKILVLTHHGRPQSSDKEIDMEPIRRRLADLLHEPVRQIDQLFGSGVDAILGGLEPGSVALLPNVRLDEREEANNQAFAKELTNSAEVYVNEAFAVSHREHASVATAPHLLQSCAGRRTVEEVRVLESLRTSAERPFVAVTSGAKIHTKVGMLRSLAKVVDVICVGGRIANILLAAKDMCPNHGFSDQDLAIASTLLEEINHDKLILPEDVVIGNETGGDAQIVGVEEIPVDVEGVWDIGPKTVARFIEECKKAKTVLWNGPVGRAEVKAYATATAELVGELSQLDNYRVIGGGDTVNALERLRATTRFSHVSVGGGALVAYLEGADMPGLEPLYE